MSKIFRFLVYSVVVIVGIFFFLFFLSLIQESEKAFSILILIALSTVITIPLYLYLKLHEKKDEKIDIHKAESDKRVRVIQETRPIFSTNIPLPLVIVILLLATFIVLALFNLLLEGSNLIRVIFIFVAITSFLVIAKDRKRIKRTSVTTASRLQKIFFSLKKIKIFHFLKVSLNTVILLLIAVFVAYLALVPQNIRDRNYLLWKIRINLWRPKIFSEPVKEKYSCPETLPNPQLIEIEKEATDACRDQIPKYYTIYRCLIYEIQDEEEKINCANYNSCVEDYIKEHRVPKTIQRTKVCEKIVASRRWFSIFGKKILRLSDSK